MTLFEYQRLAMRTSPDDGHNRVKNGCMGLIGECGELMDVLKKWMYQSGDNPRFPADRVIDECGDILWYCAELTYGLAIPLHIADHYKEPHPEYFAYLTIESVVAQLSFVVATIYRLQNFDGMSVDGPGAVLGWRSVTTTKRIANVIGIVESILRRCGSDLSDAMRRNIDKLAARYPEGFDPARSMAREAVDAPPWEV